MADRQLLLRGRCRAAWFLAMSLLAASAAPAPLPNAARYEWELPRGFPRPLVPADNPMSAAKVELGFKLFNDTRLSSTQHYSCASCHQRERAFTDGRAKAVGATGVVLRRSSMTLANAAYSTAFTWSNSNVRSLEAQMRQPLFNDHPIEMGLHPREHEVVERLSADDSYRQLFTAAFPQAAAPVTLDNIIKAIASYERSLISGRSAFDRYVFDDEATALSDAAKRGMTLFFSERVGCAKCHSGLNFSGPLVYEQQAQGAALFANTGLYNLDGRGSYPAEDRGLIEVTHRNEDMGKFRVPTLRNVAITAPYMHDGSVLTLEEVLDHYAQGGRQTPLGPTPNNRSIDSRLRPIALTAAEKLELIAFLQSLTDPEFVGHEIGVNN